MYIFIATAEFDGESDAQKLSAVDILEAIKICDFNYEDIVSVVKVNGGENAENESNDIA